jgi:aryl-alcohol dehydrogenase-like predicted oxidoreductase
MTAARAGTAALGDEITVNRLGLGAMWIPGPGDGREILHRALELGVNLIDTADTYGGGHSEEAIAAALHPYPADLVIATKGGQVRTEDGPAPDGRPAHLRAACEASLRRLRLDTIPLYQFHNPDPKVPLEESIGALVQLRDEGKVRLIGVSNVFAGRLEGILDEFPIVSVQNLYHLEGRQFEHGIAACEARGVVFLPYRPLASGALAERSGAVAEVARAHGATPAQVAIAWLLTRSPVMAPIPGTRSVEHLEENVAAAALELSDAELAALEAANRPG